MDSRRASRAVIDPKVRQVGFFAPGAPPNRSQSGPPDPTFASSSSPPLSDISPSGNSLSPVMIPPPRHLSDNLLQHIRPAALPVALPLRGEPVAVGSYDPSVFFPSSYSNKIGGGGDGEFFNGIALPGRKSRSNAGKVASSFPRGGFDLTAMKANSVPVSALMTVSAVNDTLEVVGEMELLIC